MKMKPNSIVILVAIFTFFATSCSTHQSHISKSSRSVANSELDALNEKFKSYYDSELSAARKKEIQTVQENLLKYLLEATGSDDNYKLKIYNEASSYFNKIYPLLLENIKVEKSGQESFATINSAPIWTLKDEIKFLNQEVVNLPEPKLKINLIEGLEMITPLYKNIRGEFSINPSFGDLENVIEFNGSDDEKILKLIGLVESKIKKHEISIRNVGSEIAKSSQVDMAIPQIRLIVKFMDYYFNNISNDVIKTIMSELITAGPKMTQEGMLNIVFQNTGPGLGKVLQQMAKEKGTGEAFSKLLEILESSGKPVPIHLVREVVILI